MDTANQEQRAEFVTALRAMTAAAEKRPDPSITINNVVPEQQPPVVNVNLPPRPPLKVERDEQGRVSGLVSGDTP